MSLTHTGVCTTQKCVCNSITSVTRVSVTEVFVTAWTCVHNRHSCCYMTLFLDRFCAKVIHIDRLCHLVTSCWTTPELRLAGEFDMQVREWCWQADSLVCWQADRLWWYLSMVFWGIIVQWCKSGLDCNLFCFHLVLSYFFRKANLQCYARKLVSVIGVWASLTLPWQSSR
jgi:hypothetical protein